MRAVIYARYSTDMQSAASIEDQIRLCRERVAREGWNYLHAYHDRAMSGSSHLRSRLPEAVGGRAPWRFRCGDRRVA